MVALEKDLSFSKVCFQDVRRGISDELEADPEVMMLAQETPALVLGRGGRVVSLADPDGAITREGNNRKEKL